MKGVNGSHEAEESLGRKSFRLIGDLGMNWRIIFKWIVKKYNVRV
jgi:hypothetical protein